MTNTLGYLVADEPILEELDATTAKRVTFAKQLNGYDRNEVDRYVESLSEAYRQAYDEYNSIYSKYNELLEKNDSLNREQEESKSDVVFIAKTLIDTEKLASEIITDAQVEADRIKDEAETKRQKLMEKAYRESMTAKTKAQNLLDEANAVFHETQERARAVIRNARFEAAKINSQARRNNEKVSESIGAVIKILQDLMSAEMPGQYANKQDTPVFASATAPGGCD